MIQMFLCKACRRKISFVLLLAQCFQLIFPVVSSGLTSGPVQPETQGFEPVGTTDMVDPFTGDFIYNIPLMDVEGYPINIAYHGGIGMEQEASWVGLGWNINPGVVNRMVRGLPDDFAGDTIDKDMYIRPEVTTKIGLLAGLEIAGLGKPVLNASASFGGYVTFSNYRGVSVDFSTKVGVNAHIGNWASAGMNVGASVGSQTGASVSYDRNWGLGLSGSINGDISAGASFNWNIGGNYSPRTGRHDYKGFQISAGAVERRTGSRLNFSAGTTVPIGTFNTTSFNTNKSYMNSFYGQFKLGGEFFGLYGHAELMGSVNTCGYERDGSRAGFGYFNLDKASSAGTDVLDFSREKDGLYNTTMDILPQTHLTYDVFSVSGQGTGGSFRPVRNDIGSVYDPSVINATGAGGGGGIELGFGNSFEFGLEFATTKFETKSGPWLDYKRSFTGPAKVGSYEDIYFKEAGELTENNEAYLNGIGTDTAVTTPEDAIALPPTKAGSNTRVTRANYIYTLTGDNKDTASLLDGKTITSYIDTTGFRNYPTVSKVYIPRVDQPSVGKLRRKSNQVTEIVQVQKDGRRYIYGLPVLNNVQREATFAIDESQADKTNYLASYTAGTDDNGGNGHGIDHFYSSTVTPAYVSAHLLTSVLSADYSDVTGDGISDDDLGTYTKFNYSRKSNDYRWRYPSESGKAQYIPGFTTDKRDDKGAYLIGSREQWMLHSIETKNYVAEFYVSSRLDARGVQDGILSSSGRFYNDSKYLGLGSDGDQRSYKLDSIVLYNKHDRFTNGSGAKSIKSVIFSYDNGLCKGVPNAPANTGKLTLRKIQMRYGQSNINMSAGYGFDYDANYNYVYNSANKDRWGTYKPNNSSLNNFLFPFTEQSSATNDFAKAWSLSQISLPSGGIIKVDYESDDYAFVQDKPAMEMMRVAGFGDGSDFDNGSELYQSAGHQHLFLYFNRRKWAENTKLSFRENYFGDSTLLYFNIPVSLAGGAYEPIKGYAVAKSIGPCTNDSLHGYVELEEKDLQGTNCTANPIVFTALNVGRYSLPQVMYKGCDPDASDIQNVGAGMMEAVLDAISVFKNPIQHYMDQSKAKYADLSKSFVRLQSPGLMKKGGGQRVHAIKFYDNWAAMAKGNEAIYGKIYDYTTVRQDGKGIISSGVASWEPASGGDELPQRLPKRFEVQPRTKFPPSDAIDLYNELPIGESFFPAPVVGYSKVTARSIHLNEGRSSQSEDVYYFYTAKDFPIRTQYRPIKKIPDNEFKLTNTRLKETVTQGFAIVLNDMHGKPLNTEHWVIKPDSNNSRELISYQKNDYLSQGGQLSNVVPTYSYNAAQGKLRIANKKIGIETDITLDSRSKYELAKTKQFSFSSNFFFIGMYPMLIAFGYSWPYENSVDVKLATTTKVTQQYGILSKVTNYNQGAITELKNEVFDAQTGNVLVTSLNNEFKDRQYSVNYPAHWGYKELGPAYENQNMRGEFDTVQIDTFGKYASRFLNYNGAYSYQYTLPSNMPVGLAKVSQDMPNYKLGDEMLLWTSSNAQPIKTWVMGYTSDTAHCYVVMATREPYKSDGAWYVGQSIPRVGYRVNRSGNKNRLGETIQSYSTTDAGNAFPFLKDDLSGLISFNAQRFNHNLNQVYAANTKSDSLNPFVTGKVGTYRSEMEVVNVKNRDYTGGTVRKTGTYSSASYWKTEKDDFESYCDDSIQCAGSPINQAYMCTYMFDTLWATYLGGDSLEIKVKNLGAQTCSSAHIDIKAGTLGSTAVTFPLINVPGTYMQRAVCHLPASSFAGLGVTTWGFACNMWYYNCGCMDYFELNQHNGGPGPIGIIDLLHLYTGGAGTYGAYGYGAYPGSGKATLISPYNMNSPSSICHYTPYRVRKKILLDKVGHYDGSDEENWVKTQQVTKYNWYGSELENKEEGIGYNSAIYGYNQQLPICVAKNARHSEVLFDGLEDYALLQSKPSIREEYMRLIYSPIAPFIDTATSVGNVYRRASLGSKSAGLSITNETAHTGNYSLKTTAADTISLNGGAKGMTSGYSFKIDNGRRYVATLWARTSESMSPNALNLGYSSGASVTLDTLMGAPSSKLITNTLLAKSTVIDGWQQFEVVFEVPAGYKNANLTLSQGYYYDDIRIFPFESNSKGFVYHPVTRKLMASLDENNYATFYEYDAEGNLVRTKKETEQGILTVSESRSTHHKAN